jgi:hypothetical protein
MKVRIPDKFTIEQIESFQKLYDEKKGVRLTHDDAEELSTRLIGIVGTAFKIYVKNLADNDQCDMLGEYEQS